ncbi:MAG: AI-2E family transporter [Bdellovibrionia bacterium]
MTSRKLFLALVTLAFLYVSAPLLFPVAMGGVVSVLFMPILFKIEKRQIPPSIAAAVLTLGITIVLIFPISILTFSAAKSGLAQLQGWRKPVGIIPTVGGTGLRDSFMNSAPVHNLLVSVTNLIPIEISDLMDTFQGLIDGVGSRMADLLGGVLGQVPGMLLGLLVMMVSIYFFMVDGRKLGRLIRKNTIFTSKETDRLLKTLSDTCRSVILAAVVSGAAQALLEVAGCIVSGTPNLLFIGFFVFLGSFIPVVGSSPVTLIVALQQFLEGRKVAGMILLITALLIVMVDNLIRPLFLKGSAHLHPLVAFIAAFGGLQTMGFLGVFLGPIVAALFVTTAEMFMQQSSK